MERFSTCEETIASLCGDDAAGQPGRPGVLAFEVQQHLQTCGECRAVAWALELLEHDDDPSLAASGPGDDDFLAAFWDRVDAPDSEAANGKLPPSVVVLRRRDGGALRRLAWAASILLAVGLTGLTWRLAGDPPFPDPAPLVAVDPGASDAADSTAVNGDTTSLASELYASLNQLPEDDLALLVAFSRTGPLDAAAPESEYDDLATYEIDVEELAQSLATSTTRGEEKDS